MTSIQIKITYQNSCQLIFCSGTNHDSPAVQMFGDHLMIISFNANIDVIYKKTNQILVFIRMLKSAVLLYVFYWISLYVSMASFVCECTGQCAIPQFISDEDDPSLQDSGSKHLQHILIFQAVEKCGEVDVFQPGIQWTGQTDDLVESDHCHKYANSDTCMSSLHWQVTDFQLLLQCYLILKALWPCLGLKGRMRLVS